MKEIHSDINIVGGGLIGSITALCLSKLDFEVTILEKKPKFNSKNHKDQRTIAISEGTKIFFDKIGLWNEMKPLCQFIEKIKVVDRELSNQLEFDNVRRKSNLGYIIKNIDLLNLIYLKIKKNRNIKIINNIHIKDIQFDNEKIIICSEVIKVISDLNIAADGKFSTVRKIFKTPYYSKNYKKNALVLTFTHSKDHKSTAFEFFYKNGPLAILPMKKTANNFSSSIVWTHNTEYLKFLIELENKKLKAILNEKTQDCVGLVEKIISKQMFPLSTHLNTRFFEKRTVYIGDSAHSFHPIAGQGWNLGINDLNNLYEIIKKYKSLGIEVGNQSFCKEYQNKNFYNSYTLYQVTDKLDSIFKLQNPIIEKLRFFGISNINNFKKLKNKISDFAMRVN